MSLKKIVTTYKPQKTKEVAITLNLVLKDEIPIYERARRLPSVEQVPINEVIQKWLHEGIIRPSISEYASPIVVVRKKNGNIRLCVDYRKLNKKIFEDRYPLPLIEEQLDKL